MRVPLLYLIACGVAAVAPFIPKPTGTGTKGAEFPGWPKRFEGRPLKGISLSKGEKRFENGFPGRMARFTDGSREVVIRWMTEETRKLHPAARCFRGFGYSVRPLPLRLAQAGRPWGCFEAAREKERLRVYTRIIDGEGNGWTDESAWYWAAVLGRTRGPWWAVTVAEKRTSTGEGESRRIGG